MSSSPLAPVDAPPSTTSAPGHATQRASYWAVAWARLRKNRVARFGVWCILAMFVLAVAAPLISLNQPLLWVDASGVHSPWTSALFNRLLFESSVDVYFNLWLVTSPALLLGLWLAHRVWGPRVRELRARVFWGILAGHLLLFCFVAPKTYLWLANNPLYHTAPLVNYRTLLEDSAALHGAAPLTSAPDASAAATDSAIPTATAPTTALFPLLRYSYQETEPTRSVVPPSGAHWFGTDKEGRDVFARMLYGTRISLTIGVVAVSLYVFIGVFLGALAGYFGGRVDNLISRLVEVMICFPTFFLILTLAALVEERSIFHVMLIIGVTSWTGVARLTRAEFLKQRQLEYVQAARALGLSQVRIIFRHVLPNALGPVLVTATFGVASAILIESSLSFLGIGDTTVPSWGETLNTGRVEQKLWLVLAPGFAIFFVVSIFNLVGEGLRDALDPKLKH